MSLSPAQIANAMKLMAQLKKENIDLNEAGARTAELLNLLEANMINSRLDWRSTRSRNHGILLIHIYTTILVCRRLVYTYGTQSRWVLVHVYIPYSYS